MTILFMTRKFPPSTGGMENYAYDLYVSLAKETDVRLIKWGRSNKYLPVVLPYFFARAFVQLLFQRIDIVHAQDGVLSPLGYVLSRVFRKPFTVVIHGLDITHPNKFYQAVIPWFVRRADVVFCISKAAADEAIKRGVAPERAVAIPLGITDDIFGRSQLTKKELLTKLDAPQDAKILLTVGRLVKRKGVAWFIENVMPQLVIQNPGIVYVVAGDGEDRHVVEAAVMDSKLDRYVRILGRVDDDMRVALYNLADIFVQPNIIVPGDMEGFGRVLLEAALCERPVVAAGIEGIKDAIIHDKNGRLVDSEDAEGYIREIGKILGDAEYAQNLGKKSRKYTLDHYQWSEIASQYLARYENLGK